MDPRSFGQPCFQKSSMNPRVPTSPWSRPPQLPGPDVAQGVAQAVAHEPGAASRSRRPTRRRPPSAPAGPMPFVWRRGGVYQFRRRLPKKLTELGAPALLCLSLRTEVLPEAMKRAAAIIAAVERVEAEVTTNLVRMITPAAMALIVREAARAALDEIVRRDAVAQVRTEAEADAARAGLEQEIARLRSALRLRDGEPARDATRQAMSALQIPGSGDAPALVEREVLGTLLDVKTAELGLRGRHDARAGDPGPSRSAVSGADRRADRAPGDAERGHRGRAPKRGVPRHGAQGRGDRKMHARVPWRHAARAVPREGEPARLPALAPPPAETARQEPQAKQVQQDRNRARQARRHRRGGRRGPQDHR